MNNIVSFPQPPGDGGQSGGTGGGGMEARVARLEADVSHIAGDVSDLKADFREFRSDLRDTRERLIKVEEKIAHLPGKGFIVTTIVLALAVITGLLAFQSRIQAFVGNDTGPVAPTTSR